MCVTLFCVWPGENSAPLFNAIFLLVAFSWPLIASTAWRAYVVLLCLCVFLFAHVSAVVFTECGDFTVHNLVQVLWRCWSLKRVWIAGQRTMTSGWPTATSTSPSTARHWTWVLNFRQSCQMSGYVCMTSFNLGWDSTRHVHNSNRSFTWQPGLKNAEECM